MPVFDQLECVFVHIAKTAGSSVSLMAGGERAGGHHHWRWYSHYYPDEWRTYETATLVRHPVARLESAYAFARMERSYWFSPELPHPDHHRCLNVTLSELVMTGDVACRAHPSFRPQAQFVERGSLDRVIRLEDVGRQLRLGRKLMDMPHINPSAALDRITDPAVLDVVQALYADDFELWEASRDSPL